MKYKTVVKVFALALLLFLLTVVLGSKFNWVKYLKEEPVLQGQDLAASNEALGETDTKVSTKKKPSTAHVEIVSDTKVSNTTAEHVKNDCIRASRRAGVGDSEIHAVVRECVELSLQAKKNQVGSGSKSDTSNDIDNTNNNRDNNVEPSDSNMSLTRGACEMVVADEVTLNTEEKETLIAQCVKENSQ
jgi:hypothetical protein